MTNVLIGGLQKTTLIDFPGKLACTIFTKGCNLKCPYCHNSSLVLQENNKANISEDEVFKFLRKRRGVLEGVCISGGEPLIHNNLADFMVKIKEMGYFIKLDTNGFFPIKLSELIREGLLDYVAMDIKNSPDHYEKVTGLNHLDIRKINESIKILKTKQIPFEFRTTAVKGIHTISDFVSIGRWIPGSHRYYIQNYVHSADTIASKTKVNKHLETFSKKELEIFLDLLKKTIPNAKIR